MTLASPAELEAGDARRTDRLDQRTALAIAVAIPAIYLLDAWWHGAIGISRNDDWSFARTTLELSSLGHLRLVGWSQMTFVGQAYLALPWLRLFGQHLAVLQFFGALTAAVCLYSTYWTARFALPRNAAGLVTSAFGFTPIFGPLATSFMTDMPYTAFAITSIALGQRAVVGAKNWRVWLTGSLICSVVAFAIREWGIVPGVAVLIALGLERRRLRPLLPFLLPWLGSIAIFFAWRHGLPNGTASHITVSLTKLRNAGRILYIAGQTIGLLALPFVVASGALRRAVGTFRRFPRAVAGFVAADIVCTSLWLTRHGFLTLGNYVGQSLPYSATVHGHAPSILPRCVWLAIGIAANFSLASLALTALEAVHDRRRRSAAHASHQHFETPRTRVVAIFLALQMAFTVGATTATTAPLFDRNLLVTVPPFGVLLLSASSKRHGLRHAGIVACAVLAIAGLHNADLSATFDGLKWRAGNLATEIGYPATDVDAGFEWYSLHHSAVTDPGFHAMTWFKGQRTCVGLEYDANTLRPGDELLFRITARSGFGSEVRLRIVKKPRLCTTGDAPVP